jgi:hypothetical protein
MTLTLRTDKQIAMSRIISSLKNIGIISHNFENNYYGLYYTIRFSSGRSINRKFLTPLRLESFGNVDKIPKQARRSLIQ